MAREEDKHRGPEYVPAGPVRIASRQDPPDARLISRIEALEAALAKAILQCGVHGAQIASLQMAAPRGITLRGWDCACGIFNSLEKEELKACRSCGLKRP